MSDVIVVLQDADWQWLRKTMMDAIKEARQRGYPDLPRLNSISAALDAARPAPSPLDRLEAWRWLEQVEATQCQP